MSQIPNSAIAVIGIDIGKNSFHVVGHDARSENGRPGIETRFMIGLLLLKHICGLSDEAVCERWVQDPYFQFFSGEESFRHAFPHERSDLSHWRKRLGDKLELLLAESLRVAHQAGALRGGEQGFRPRLASPIKNRWPAVLSRVATTVVSAHCGPSLWTIQAAAG